jgi:TrmH family RNA methyltransferase
VATPSWQIHRLFVVEGSKISSPKAEVVTEKEMERLSALKSAPRSLALVKLPTRKAALPEEGELVLCLDEVQDPGNLGTIIRTADWYGVRHIVCSPTTADCFAPKVVQATMGALLRVEVAYTPLAEWLSRVRERGIKTYATTLDGENIHTTKLSHGGVVIMGNEGKGVSPEVQSLVSHKLFIPPYPADREGSESLNVAIATAITLENFRN